MTPLFKKLNFKNQEQILVINNPDSFEEELQPMQSFTKIIRNTTSVKNIDFVMVFAVKQEEVNNGMKLIAPILTDDATIWFCYPKKSSKKYNCEFDRDNGWDIMGKYNLEGVRMVAIDTDWSALRFRNVSKIKTITRSKNMALTAEAKRRTTKR